MHRPNTDENNFEPINSKETARSGAKEVVNEKSRLNVKRPEQDSCWQSDIPQLSNDGLGGAEQRQANRISAKSARVESVKANWNAN